MPPPTSRRGEHGHSPATQLLRAHLRARFHLITVNARATIESYTTYASTGNVMPFGVMKGTYTPGTSYTIYGDRQLVEQRRAVPRPQIRRQLQRGERRERPPQHDQRQLDRLPRLGRPG